MVKNKIIVMKPDDRERDDLIIYYDFKSAYFINSYETFNLKQLIEELIKYYYDEEKYTIFYDNLIEAIKHFNYNESSKKER